MVSESFWKVYYFRRSVDISVSHLAGAELYMADWSHGRLLEASAAQECFSGFQPYFPYNICFCEP
jgi:hypothetical protein